MATWLSRNFWKSPRPGRSPGPRVRKRSGRLTLQTEALEDRLLPSLSPMLLLAINPSFANSNPKSFTQVNNLVFFQADDGVHGPELWASNGTAAGTFLVKDINPGATGSNPSYLTNVNGTLLFSADDGTHGLELWESNGTAAGTSLVADINPGTNGSSPRFLTNVNGTLFFAADDGTHGAELWASNGATAGTFLVQDIFPGPETSFLYDLTNVNGTLFFQANDGSHGAELWSSNGTPAGTSLVKDINPASSSSYPSFLTNVNGSVFFEANDGTHGKELWASNGSPAGTILVKDINPGGSDSNPFGLTNMNGTLFFSADDGTHGAELWESNGTAAGTFLVSDINPGGSASSPFDLTNVNGTLFFSANDGTHGVELWESNGAAAGTFLVQDINPGAGNSYPGYITNVNGSLFFSARDGTHGQELWASNGTGAGTFLVKDIDPGSFGSYPRYLTNVNHTLFFSDDDMNGRNPWVMAVPTATAATTVTSTPNPSVSGQTVTFTATVTAVTSGVGMPTGTVNFTEGAATLASGVTLNGSDQATFTMSSLAVGSHTITASYNGDTTFQNATGDDSASPQVVNQASTTTTLTSAPDPSVFGEPVTLTAIVAPVSPGVGTPTGSVNFTEGATTLVFGVPLDGSGQATFTTASLAVGSHTITAGYSGDANFQTSTGNDSASPQVVNQASTNTTLTSAPNSSAFGQTVTFTATVAVLSPGGGTPIGTVDFKDGSTDLTPGGVALAGNQATFTTAALAATSHTITAVYGGNSSFTGSQGADSQVVNPDSTTTTVLISPSTLVSGQAVAFVAIVSNTTGPFGAPTGSVQFAVDGVNFGSPVALVSGVALSPPSKLLAASSPHAVLAIYTNSDGDFINGNGSATKAVAKDATKTVLTSTPTSAVAGQVVAFIATLNPVAPGSGTPTGTVDFKDSATDLTPGGVALSNGKATFTISSLGLGHHTITATYGGDANFTGSSGNDASAPVVVNQASSRTVMTSFPDPSVFGQPVTFTVAVIALLPSQGTPTGTVAFTDGSTTIGVATLNGAGRATFTMASLSRGNHAINANYGGDAKYQASSYLNFGETVLKDATATTVTPSANPAVVGATITFTAAVQASSPGAGIPTGTVTFKDNTTVLGTGTLSSAGQATFSTSGQALGTHAITASYGGDNNFTGSFAPNVPEVIKSSAKAAVVNSAPSRTNQGTAPLAPTPSGLGQGLSAQSVDNFFGPSGPTRSVPSLRPARPRRFVSTRDWLETPF
jgi:ELWxxDGT repeat protein